MQVDLILTGIIIVLLIHSAWTTRENMREREKLTHALIAKTANDFTNMELASKVQNIHPPEEELKDPNMVAVDQLNDEQWDEAIIKEGL